MASEDKKIKVVILTGRAIKLSKEFEECNLAETMSENLEIVKSIFNGGDLNREPTDEELEGLIEMLSAYTKFFKSSINFSNSLRRITDDFNKNGKLNLDYIEFDDKYLSGGRDGTEG